MSLPGDIKDLGYIRRCRDLVELLYGVRMVASIVENDFQANGAQQHLVTIDPRRIRLEVILSNQSTTTQKTVGIGTPISFEMGTQQVYELAAGATVIFTRDFRTDLDAVTLALDCQASDFNVTFSTRETVLTPPPVDETPR